MTFTKMGETNHGSRTVASSAAFLLPHLQPHMSLLDIGCGPGSISLGFLPYLPQGKIVGVDYSADVVHQAHARLKDAGDAISVTFQTGSVYELPFGDNPFDVVYSYQTFPHLTDPVKELKEIRRLLKPSGICASRDADTYCWSPALLGLELYTSALARKMRNGGSTFPPGREMR